MDHSDPGEEADDHSAANHCAVDLLEMASFAKRTQETLCFE
jgi:hypothetical protein